MNALVDGFQVDLDMGPPAAAYRRPDLSASTRLLGEDDVKVAVKSYLETRGWSVTIAWGRQRGVDIEAHRGHKHAYFEAKGEAANPAQQVNYFIGALGELVQRMRDPSATYGLALPDNAQYRRLVDRFMSLPASVSTFVRSWWTPTTKQVSGRSTSKIIATHDWRRTNAMGLVEL